jgi:hypothetical protein
VANAQATPQVTEITGADFPEGAISSIAVGPTDDTLLVTFSNYGVNSVWQTFDGGISWESKEANLPDMPVRWALYHPSSPKHAMLATELGIWTTSTLDEPGTVWVQDIEGLANVRIDMLQLRQSDFTVLAATHGRGLATATWDIQTGAPEPSTGSSFTIYPNPTQGRFTLRMSDPGSQQVSIDLTDLGGKRVRDLFQGTWIRQEAKFDLSGLPTGTYICRVTTEKGSFSEKIFLY